jgi:adenine deaminase
MAIKEKILNGERFVCQMGETWVHESKINNKEIKMNKKTAISMIDRQVITGEIIKFIKTNHPDFNANDICKVLANAYTTALQAKKELVNG